MKPQKTSAFSRQCITCIANLIYTCFIKEKILNLIHNNSSERVYKSRSICGYIISPCASQSTTHRILASQFIPNTGFCTCPPVHLLFLLFIRVNFFDEFISSIPAKPSVHYKLRSQDSMCSSNNHLVARMYHTLRKNSSPHCISSSQSAFCRYSIEWAD